MGGRPRRAGTFRRRALTAASAAAACAVVVSPVRAAISLRVIPFPGTPDAPPSSQVIFSALRPSELEKVTLTGSRSGRHTGRLEALPAGAGTAFVPLRPFTPGETVRVGATLTTPQAGTASGDPGARRLRFSFRVGMFQTAPAAPSELGAGLENGPWMSDRGTGGTQHFRSAPGLHPPIVESTRDPDRSSGDIFMAPLYGAQAGPMILDSQGRLLWFSPLTDPLALNFAVQRYRGQPVLTWSQGQYLGGEGVILDRSYRTVALVHPGNGLSIDLHEFQITPRGTALITCFDAADANLTSVGGPADGRVADGAIQEVDIKTGKVLWEWHSLGHVPVSASYARYDPKASWYDYFHLNSIQQLPDGNLLVSARNTWAVYEISRRTGKVIWTLGGKYSSFKMGAGTTFEWQHDARLRGRTLSVFDDAGDPQEERQSSAKIFKLDTHARTVSLVRRLTHHPPLLAGAGGSAQRLSNGNWFVGWGSNPQFSEYTPQGRQLFNAAIPLGEWTYRAFRFHWQGRPLTRPSLALAARPDGHVEAYSSWNGATLLKAWRVLGGSSPSGLKPLGLTASRSGFETALDVPDAPRYLAVQALGGTGKVLRTSAPVADPSHLAIFGSSIFVPVSGGDAEVPVVCSSAHDCRVTVSVSTGGTVLGRSAPARVDSYRGQMVHVRLRAAGHGSAVDVTASDGADPSVTRSMTLIPYSASGASHHVTVRTAPGVQLAGPTAFVSLSGRAGVLTACYSGSPCRFQETVSSAGHVIGRASHVRVGADELSYAEIQLNKQGRAQLAQARGNRLPAQLELTVNGRSRTGEIDLIRYG